MENVPLWHVWGHGDVGSKKWQRLMLILRPQAKRFLHVRSPLRRPHVPMSLDCLVQGF